MKLYIKRVSGDLMGEQGEEQRHHPHPLPLLWHSTDSCPAAAVSSFW